MANFISEFLKGQAKKNRGMSMGEGLKSISRAINGIQQGMTYGVAAAPKCGKSTFTDYGFVISPYLESLKTGKKVRFTYFSFEMDRVTKEFDFASYFLYHDYGIEQVILPENITVEGKNIIPLSSSYLRGRVQDDNGEVILIDKDINDKLKKVYLERIIPLFGEYNLYGIQIKKGLIEFIEQKENPTGLRNKIIEINKEDGEFIYEEFVDKEGNTGKKLASYIPKDEDLTHIVITDTIRKLNRERNFSLKETIDKYLEYCTELRNICKTSFVHIVHLNRDMSDINRLKFLGDMVFPSPESIKDTGNLSEECDHLFTLFNPNDERYNLTQHFGVIIKDSSKNELYPNMRTVHLVESRHAPFPQHFRLEMQGNIKNFKKLNI